jgi:SAM-dependent methyltransferase
VLRCVRCGLGLTQPQPTAAELARFYDSAYYEHHAMGADAAAGWPARAAEIMARVPTRPSRVLDWGAGQGHFVAALRRLGLDAEGVEPSPSAREAACVAYGIELRPTLPAAGCYDLITLIHSLEHVPDPAGVLAALARCAAPGGVLFIEVPHAASFEMWRPARRRQILSLPAHLVHFTPASLCRLVESVALKVEAVHLINPDWLEWLFALRAGLKRGSARPRDTRVYVQGSGGMAPESVTASGVRSLWRTSLLPRIREHSPGWRFQVVARVPPGAAG